MIESRKHGEGESKSKYFIIFNDVLANPGALGGINFALAFSAKL